MPPAETVRGENQRIGGDARPATGDERFLRIDPQNIASIRVGEKNGFEREGVLKRDFRTTDGTLLDVLVLGRVK